MINISIVLGTRSEIIKMPRVIRECERLGPNYFILRARNANLVLTNSGGAQEETCVLGVPCVTIRDNTERPETVEVGSSVMDGADSDRILECAKMMIAGEDGWENPSGNGEAGNRTVEVLTEKLVR